VLEPRGAVADLEREVLAACAVPVSGWRAPRGVRLRGGRRPLRVRPEQASVEALPEGLLLACTLPPGSYATVLLACLLRVSQAGRG
jgi:tRNA(Glu) U13 pseudouridine synthase TruD